MNIRAQQWYNGEPPRNLTGFIDDKSNRLIGWASIRQLRVRSNSCSTQRFNVECRSDYSFFREEKSSFRPGWSNATTSVFNRVIHRAFEYQPGDELDTYVYNGQHDVYASGGYVYQCRGRLSDLRSNLSLLHRLGWIDQHTRAVIIQLTLYNPNVQLFTAATFLVEFLATGGIYPQTRFQPFNFQSMSMLFALLSAHSSPSLLLGSSPDRFDPLLSHDRLLHDHGNSLVHHLETSLLQTILVLRSDRYHHLLMDNRGH